MASSFETLVFDIIARDAQASAAFDRFRRTVELTSASVDKNTAAADKNKLSWAALGATATANAIPALVGAGAALGGLVTVAGAAGLGVAAFGVMAKKSITPVTTALSGPGGLAASWMTLDNRQRNAALGVQALGARYTNLSKAMEPTTFQVFTHGLALANELLGPVAKLATSAGQGISAFLADFTANSGLAQFITYLSHLAGPAIALLGHDITMIARAVFALLQSFGGAGLLELKALTGVITALASSITFLAQHAPLLTSVAVSIGGIAFALAKIGALGAVLKLSGLASIATQMTGFAAATEGASLAERGLLATTTALDAITPFGWAVLAAAALAPLVFWLSRFKSVTDTAIATIEKQNRAQGFNTAGYYAAAVAIGTANAAQDKQRVTLMNLHTGMVTGTAALGDITGATAAYTAAQAKLIAEGNSQQTFLTTLENKYGITRSQAIALAKASGVLASQVNQGGTSLKEATAKTEAYANANLKAQRPTSQLAADMSDFANKTLTATQRTTALTSALNLFFNPAVTADQAVVTLKNDQAALAKALDASGGKTGFLTQKQRDARSAFDTYINDVATAAQDAFTATNRTSSYTDVINKALPVLLRAAGNNKTLREEIQKLIDTEKGLHPESVPITVTAYGKTIYPGAIHARGGLIPGTGSTDSYPALLTPGEVVVPKPMVAAGAVDHLRGRLPGFAAGGLVGNYANGMPGLVSWFPRAVKALDAQLIHDEGSFLAAQYKKWAAAHLFGSGSAIVNYAMRFLHKVPYVWGGTTPAGWDCSGATGYWYRHFGYRPPRTSQQQQLWARPSGDQPGALVFFYGRGGNASHVGLSMGTGRYIGADDPALGTTIEPTAGNTGFGIPPGGFHAAGGGGGAAGGGGTVVELGRALAAARYGWRGVNWADLRALWNRESNWNPDAVNPQSGAAGIAQRISGFGPGYARGNAAEQILWGLRYIAGRYGDPARAWGHELRAGWYDQGGWLPPGPSLAVNNTGRPEQVTPAGHTELLAEQNSLLRQLLAAARQLPRAQASELGAVLNGTSRRSAYAGLYSARG